MTEQLELSARARRNDPGTSKQAAKSLSAELITAREALVLDLITKAGPNGMTNHELVDASGLDWNSVTPRVHPLVEKGMVKDSGMRRVGPKGRRNIAWVAIDGEPLPPTLKATNLKWRDELPDREGYWLRYNQTMSVDYVTPKDIELLKDQPEYLGQGKWAGPIAPPK